MTDPEAQTLHDRLARLEQGVAAPIHRWWHHAFAVAGIGTIVVILVLLAWLVSSVVNRYNRGKALLEAAQPVVVAKDAPVLSPGELAARFGLDLAKLSKAPVVDQATLRKAAAAGAAAALAAQQRQQGASGGKAPGTNPPSGPPPGGALAPPAVAACIPLPAPGAQFYYAEKKIGPERWGATALPLLNPDNSLDLLVKSNPRPRFALGGLSRAGIRGDPLGKRFGLFIEHDFLSIGLGSVDSCAAKSWRCGRAVVLGAEPFFNHGYAPAPGEKANDKGVWISTAIDF
jgi:hypothetical protein